MSGFAFGGSSIGGSFQFGSSSNNNNNNNNSNNNNNLNTNKTNANTNNNANANANTNNSKPSFLWGSSSNTPPNLSFNIGNSNNNSFNFGKNSSNNSDNFDDGMNPMSAIQRLYNEYNGENELCRFQTVLYNKIPSSINVNLFCNKPPLIRSIIWDQGIKNNPYPNKLVPVGICGYNELNQRSNLCLAGHCSSIKRFEEITEKINILKNKINICTKQSITDLKQTQIHLSHRLLAILRVFINYQSHNSNINQNTNLNAKEIKLRNVLQQMSAESKQLVNLYGHINKLAYEKEDNNNPQNTIISTDAHHLNNPQNMKQMFIFLKQQQQFLQLLSKTVQTDIHDLNLITNGIQSKHNSPQQSILFNTFNTSSSSIFG